jgi:outer membrane receptor protein involved in Fe transport
MKKVYALLLTTLLGSMAFSQSRITGLIKDSTQKEAIPFVSVSLFKKADAKTPVKTAFSDKEGRFSIITDTGAYTMVLTHTAFAKKTVSVEKAAGLDLDLTTIYMQAVAGQLGNVTVTATRPLIEQSIDKITYNVENDPAAKTETATDILRKTPFITVDGDGNVSLNGQSNFKILMNGKETAMFARNVKEALQGFPGALIVKIEVITAPSAKYDAEGVGGIINIITKKKVIGYNGSLSSYYSTVNTYSESINLNLKTGKLGITGFYSLSGVRPQKSISLSETEAFDPTVFAKRSFDGIRTRKSFYNTGNLEISYELDSLNTVVAYGNLSGGHSNSLLDQQIVTTYAAAPNTTSTLRQDVSAEYPGSGVGADYTRKFARHPEQELVVRLNGQFNRNEDVNTSVQDNPDKDRFVLNNSESRNKEYTVQLDYVKPINKQQRLETGAKVIMRKAQSDFESLLKYNQSEDYKFNPDNTDRFQYNQEVYSGYGSYSLSLKKYSLRLGLRVEHTLINGDFITSKTKVEQDYTKFIPNVSVSRKFSPSLTSVLSYNQRLQRPYITNLNPFVNNNDSLNISYGNPNLGPQVLHTLTLQNRISKGKVFAGVTLTGSYSNDMIAQYVEYNKVTGVTSTTSGNVGEEKQLTLTFNINAPISKKVSVYGGILSRYNKTENTINKTQQVESLSGGVFIGYSYKLTNKFTITGSGNVMQLPKTLAYTNSLTYFYQVNLGYKVIGEKLSVTANFNNMHSKYFDFKNTIENANFRTVNTNRNLYRTIFFGATWRFGKLKEQASKKKGVNNDDLIQGQSNG